MPIKGSVVGELCTILTRFCWYFPIPTLSSPPEQPFSPSESNASIVLCKGTVREARSSYHVAPTQYSVLTHVTICPMSTRSRATLGSVELLRRPHLWGWRSPWCVIPAQVASSKPGGRVLLRSTVYLVRVAHSAWVVGGCDSSFHTLDGAGTFFKQVY